MNNLLINLSIFLILALVLTIKKKPPNIFRKAVQFISNRQALIQRAVKLTALFSSVITKSRKSRKNASTVPSANAVRTVLIACSKL